MNEANNINDEQPAEKPITSKKTRVGLRKKSQVEIGKILENHKIWLESDGKEGCRANFAQVDLKSSKLIGENLEKANLIGTNLEQAALIDTNLRKADLISANLKEAKLGGAILQNANLLKADLQGANLFRTNLQGAYLYRAKLNGARLRRAILQNTMLDNVTGLNEAELRYANLETVSGLLGNEFAQADLTGTTLPKNIKEFEKPLEVIKDTSQNARKIFFAMLLGCVYSWLTIGTTTDVNLLTNSASSPLPIIGTEIPIAWFYLAAPLVLICLYFYFHLYLDNLWKGLGKLPAIFPDGKALDQTAYPWLLNSIVCRHFKRLKKRPIISNMKEWIIIILAWWVVPITMTAFWLRFIPRRDWLGTGFHIGLIIISVVFAINFYRLCALSLQGKEEVDSRPTNFLKNRRFYNSLIVVVVGIFFLMFSYGAIYGERNGGPNFKKITALVPWVSKKFGYNIFADFTEKVVSEIPLNYHLIPQEERLEAVKGVNLSKRNLTFSVMYKAFLVKSDLRRADLKNANLSFANLTNANLEGADLTETILYGAELLGVKGLTIAGICKSNTLYEATIDDDLKKQVKDKCPHLLVKLEN